jgi:hypothetical protein
MSWRLGASCRGTSFELHLAGEMQPKFSILVLLATVAFTPWLVLIWGEFGWYALMVVVAVLACQPRSSVSYFSRGMLFACVVYQVLIGTEANNVVSSLLRRITYSRGFRREDGIHEYLFNEHRLTIIAHLLQLTLGVAAGVLTLWIYGMLERRDNQDKAE